MNLSGTISYVLQLFYRDHIPCASLATGLSYVCGWTDSNWFYNHLTRNSTTNFGTKYVKLLATLHVSARRWFQQGCGAVKTRVVKQAVTISHSMSERVHKKLQQCMAIIINYGGMMQKKLSCCLSRTSIVTSITRKKQEHTELELQSYKVHCRAADLFVFGLVGAWSTHRSLTEVRACMR